MNPSDYQQYDLNLLLLFDCMMRARNVTAAAYELNITQPTMSHALNRLRKMCGDQLFVRTPKGMQPTAHAEMIAPQIAAALDLMGKAIKKSDTFDPATSTRLFRILVPDVGNVTFLPPMIAHFQTHAPHLKIKTFALPEDQYKEMLESGEADLALGLLPPIVAGFYQQHLFTDQYVCVVAHDHPRIGSKITIEQYMAERHVRVELQGRRSSIVDESLMSVEGYRNVMVSVPHYLVLANLIKTSDLIATVPSGVFRAFDSPGLRAINVPFPMPKIEVRQFWHERNHADAGLVWLRAAVSRMFSPAAAD